MNNILKRKICLFFDDTNKTPQQHHFPNKKNSHCKLKKNCENSDDPLSNFLLTKKRVH